MSDFSESYIKKCIENRVPIQYLIDRSRGLFGYEIISEARCFFRPGDSFHCVGMMRPDETRTVRAIMPSSLLYSEDPLIGYPICNCVYVPTEQQLEKGLEAVRISLEKEAFGKGPEFLLDKILA